MRINDKSKLSGAGISVEIYICFNFVFTANHTQERAMPGFSHIGAKGEIRMVDVSSKKNTDRIAVASGKVLMNPETLEIIEKNAAKKGNVLEAARIAGIMAAKKTPELIPMCHPLNISHIKINFEPDRNLSAVTIKATARIFGPTGVEMEALAAVSVAALTIYDMCKSYDKGMIVTDICLLEKRGGKSGKFKRADA